MVFVVLMISICIVVSLVILLVSAVMLNLISGKKDHAENHKTTI